MRIATFTVLLSLLTASVFATDEPTLAEMLISEYNKIETISCEIRKITKADKNTIRMLSHVHFKKPDRIHVDNISPVKRTIIADGKKLYYYEKGLPHGFSRPINDLSEIWLRSLRNVPGTALEHLHNLRGIEEQSLSSTDHNLIRRGYQTKTMFVVLTCDLPNRLIGIDFFKTSSMKNKIAHYIYSAFQKVSDDCWIPTLHKATLWLPDGKQIEETRRVSNLNVNKPIAEKMFDANLFLENVDFVSDFEKIR